MIKTITLGTLLTGTYNSPLVTLLIAIVLIFLLDLYSHYIESKKISCVVPDFTSWSYNDLSTQCRLLGLKPTNRKRPTLENSLRGLIL